MFALPLTTSEKEAHLAALRADEQRVRVRVTVLDQNEKALHALDLPASQIIDGAVDVDARGEITRSLDLSFLDERHALGFDTANPTRTGLFADNFVAVERGIYVLELERWIDTPVYWGPLTGFERDGAIVKLEGMGKEELGLDPHFVTNGYTLRKGRRVDLAIRDVMDRVGETRYNLPDLGARLPRARAVEPDDEPWNVVKFGWESHRRVMRGKGKNRHRERIDVEYNGLIALAGNMTAFYDGLGRLTVRRRSRDPVLVLAEGRDILDRPKPKFDVLAARNHVVVTGAKVTQGKKPHRKQVQMRASATLASEHPLSPAKLARNGKPRRMTEFVQVDNLKTVAACRARAQRNLDERSNDGLELSFSCLPFPFLEELDVVRVQTREYALDLRLQTFTIPLGTGLMSIGWESD